MTDVRPPIDPMSDVAWARVERGLWARLDTAPSSEQPERSRRWLWIAIPSTAIAATVAIVFAIVVDKPKPIEPVAVTPLPPVEETAPTRFVSGDSPSTASFGDTHVTLDPQTAIVMPHASDTAVLEHGAAWFAVAPRSKPFVVVAGDTVVRVIATRFRVARYEERATVEVERGVVEITFRGTTTKVSGGESWTSDAPSIVEKPAPTAVVEPKPVPKRTVAKTDDERAKYERMSALEASEPANAMTGYLEIARGTSSWAQLSLYAAARLSADRGETRAKTLLEMYTTRFPRGANIKDVRLILDRLKGVTR